MSSPSPYATLDSMAYGNSTTHHSHTFTREEAKSGSWYTAKQLRSMGADTPRAEFLLAPDNLTRFFRCHSSKTGGFRPRKAIDECVWEVAVAKLKGTFRYVTHCRQKKKCDKYVNRKKTYWFFSLSLGVLLRVIPGSNSWTKRRGSVVVTFWRTRRKKKYAGQKTKQKKGQDGKSGLCSDGLAFQTGFWMLSPILHGVAKVIIEEGRPPLLKRFSNKNIC